MLTLQQLHQLRLACRAAQTGSRGFIWRDPSCQLVITVTFRGCVMCYLRQSDPVLFHALLDECRKLAASHIMHDIHQGWSVTFQPPALM